MKIIKNEKDDFIEVNKLYKGLGVDINKKNIISFVGGGGKTSSIYTLANEAADLGKKVVIITTTHIAMPKENVLLDCSIDDIKEALNKINMITVASYGEEKRLGYIGDKVASRIIECCDLLLVEADGSKMLPLKAPANHEPVIFEGSNMVVGVAGIDALGKYMKSICHRPEIVKDVLKVSDNHIINEEDISKLLSSERGQRKNINSLNTEYRVIINKVDNEELLFHAKKVFGYLNEEGINGVITSYIKNY